MNHSDTKKSIILILLYWEFFAVYECVYKTMGKEDVYFFFRGTKKLFLKQEKLHMSMSPTLGRHADGNVGRNAAAWFPLLSCSRAACRRWLPRKEASDSRAACGMRIILLLCKAPWRFWFSDCAFSTITWSRECPITPQRRFFHLHDHLYIAELILYIQIHIDWRKQMSYYIHI